MKFRSFLLLMALCGGAALGAEAPEKVPVDPEHAAKMARGLELFKTTVRGTLVSKCLSCHGGEKTEARFDLVDREQLLKGGAKGPAVKPGKPRESLLYQVLAHEAEPAMPYGEDPLPPETVATIAAWIECGAPYDAPLVGDEEKSAWTKKQISPEARSFWAFGPLANVAPPTVQDTSWPRTPVDRFILSRLEAANLRPNPAAQKHQLLRRAYFDLVGLPPTPEEISAFINDETPDAFDRALDRLLESPRYGERWARHWLDLARFAESHGYEHDYDRPTAYHYRDFVIEALNLDLPFDTFVRWQLAGDEIAPQDSLALKATGFLAAGVHSTQITANEAERHRYDELDDVVNTIGTSMLGLSLGCARCHDHKFDPIPAGDYYRLLSAFTLMVRTEMDLDLDPQAYQKERAAFDLAHRPFAEKLAAYERDQLPARFSAWEAEGAPLARLPWIVLQAEKAASSGGATLTRQADGSYLVGGANPTQDTYTFVIPTTLRNIRALRLEALSDPSLVKGGPGRASNGNFGLSRIRVTAAPLDQPGQAVNVPLSQPRSTFDQTGLGIANALDDNPASGWAVDPQFGKGHAAAFVIEGEIGYEKGTLLTVTLDFRVNTQHGMGRPRLSVSTGEGAIALDAPAVPQEVITALAKPIADRAPEDTQRLLTWYRELDPGWQALRKEADDHLAQAPQPKLVKALTSSEGLPPIRLHSQGPDFYPETFFLRRGDVSQKQGVAPLGFLQVLMPSNDVERWVAPRPEGRPSSYRRTALANWLTDVDQGAGRLVARVIVNRLWQHHLGRGIVATPNDFGDRGERPTHPELLDYLAGELIRQGWRLKPIHKLIMTSAVYRQSSQIDETHLAADRDNQLVWRNPRRRLQAEVVRDSMLATGGLLDLSMYGPGTLDPRSKRRSIYFTIKRSQLMPMMQIFDAPDALQGVGERPTTTVAPQALFMLNNPLARESAAQLAQRVSGPKPAELSQMIERAYLTALGRSATNVERTDAEAFIAAQTASYAAAGKADANVLAWTDFCQVLLCLNEFVYVD